MSSAFKNFFITFIVCLLIFGFVGFKFVYPKLNDVVNISGVIDPDTSSRADVSEASGDEPTETSVPSGTDDYDAGGDIFTSSVALCDDSGRALACAFLDANGKSRRFITCSIPTTVKIVNEVGVSVPIGDVFPSVSNAGICSAFSALTGITTDYCVRVNREALAAIVKLIPGAYVNLTEDVSFINPQYADFTPGEGEAYPDNYFITIAGGTVMLNETLEGRTKLEWLLDYNPNVDGSDYNAIYTAVGKAIFKQFFEAEGSLKSTSTLAGILSKTDTNLTSDAVSAHLDTIFSYNSFRRYDEVYPGNWEKGVEHLRELDGRRE